MKILDPGHPFFRPKWRRIVLTLICFGWAVVEFVNGAPAWAAVFVAIGAYLGWVLLIAYDPAGDDGPDT